MTTPNTTASFLLFASTPAVRGSIFERFSYMPLSSASFGGWDKFENSALYGSGIAVVSQVGPVVKSPTMRDEKEDCYCMSQAMRGLSDVCAYCQERKRKMESKKAETKVVLAARRGGGKNIQMGLLIAEDIVRQMKDRDSWPAGTTLHGVLNEILTKLGNVSVRIGMDQLFAKMQTPEAKLAAERLFQATPQSLGNAARLAGSGYTLEERNKIEDLAREQFSKGDYSTEMLLRGLLVRSDQVNDLRVKLQDSPQKIIALELTKMQLEKKVQELEGRLKFTYERMDKKTEINRNLLAQLNKTKKDKDAADLKVHELKDEIGKLAKDNQRKIDECVKEVDKLIKKHERPTWKSADGKVRLPEDFEDAHLLNTIRFIERRYEEREEDPEEIACDADGDWTVYAENELPRVYPALLAEARERKLLLAKDRLTAKVVEQAEQ